MQQLREIAASKTNIGYVRSVTSLFVYKSLNKFYSNVSKKDIYPNFKVPELGEIKKLLEQVDSVMY